MTELDRSVLEWFVDHREPWLTPVMRAVTILGGSALLIPLALALGVWFWRRRQTLRPLALLAGAYVGSWVFSNSIKALTDRARPPVTVAIGSYDSPAFPSGHATHAAAVWLMVAAVLAATTAVRHRQSAVWVTAVVIVVFVGITRLYLAAHWLSDVLVGWTLGALWTGAVVTALGVRSASPRQRPRQRRLRRSPPG